MTTMIEMQQDGNTCSPNFLSYFAPVCCSCFLLSHFSLVFSFPWYFKGGSKFVKNTGGTNRLCPSFCVLPKPKCGHLFANNGGHTLMLECRPTADDADDIMGSQFWPFGFSSPILAEDASRPPLPPTFPRAVTIRPLTMTCWQKPTIPRQLP